MEQLHFIAGTPRSGSTLLSAILFQNPGIYAGISSPVANLFDGLIKGMGAHSEYLFSIDDDTRHRVLCGLFENYYSEIPVHYVFDTNRYWCSKVAALQALLPRSKIICCVRDLCWILDSFERLFAKNPLIISKVFAPNEGKTVYQRVDALMAPNGTIGFAWAAFQEAYYGPLKDKLIVIDYEHLAEHPAEVMSFLYGRLEIKPFEQHNFERIRKRGGLFDEQLGLPGLHDVTGPVRNMTPAQTILPPDIFERYKGKAFWR